MSQLRHAPVALSMDRPDWFQSPLPRLRPVFYLACLWGGIADSDWL